MSVDGGATTTPDQIQIDTSVPGTHTVLYTATDPAGLTASAERTLNVLAPQPQSPATTTAATSSPDTTTSTTTTAQ